MSNVILEIPEEPLQGVRLPRGHVEENLRRELALQLYREGLIPNAGACRLAGMQKSEFQYLLGERGICQPLATADLEEDLERLKALGGN